MHRSFLTKHLSIGILRERSSSISAIEVTTFKSHTMTSADFSPFVVTHEFHTLFPSADEISLGTTRHFLSIYLPHLLQLIPSSYWTSTCLAALSLTVASCDFCSSDQRFASTFLQIPLALITGIAVNRTPLVLAVSFPLPRRIRIFHPLATCATRRTKKAAYSEIRISGSTSGVKYIQFSTS